MSGGQNTVIFDDLGMPSVVFPFAKQTYADLIPGGSQETFPSFIVDGVEKDIINISKFQNIVVNNRAYSLPMEDPRVYIDFDTAVKVCRNKGNGWALMPGSLWQAVALWRKKNGTIPHGNSDYGVSSDAPLDKCTALYDSEQRKFIRNLTGSGPATWNHNHLESGISDLNGNIWEWTADVRLKNGEYQIIPDGNCMRFDCDMSVTSPEWRAIKPDGTLVTPGTDGTLKVDGIEAGTADARSFLSGKPKINTVRSNPTYTGSDTDIGYGWLFRPMGTLGVEPNVNIPQIMKAYGLFPAHSDLKGDGFYARNYGERLSVRGGAFNASAYSFELNPAGVFSLVFDLQRPWSADYLGFRSVFVDL